MSNSFLVFLKTAALYAIVYGCVLFLFNLITRETPLFDWGYVVQTVLFAVLFTLFIMWHKRKKAKK